MASITAEDSDQNRAAWKALADELKLTWGLEELAVTLVQEVLQVLQE